MSLVFFVLILILMLLFSNTSLVTILHLLDSEFLNALNLLTILYILKLDYDHLIRYELLQFPVNM